MVEIWMVQKPEGTVNRMKVHSDLIDLSIESFDNKE